MDPDLAEKLHRRIRRMESTESSSETSSIGLADEYDLSQFNSEYARTMPRFDVHDHQKLTRLQIEQLMQIFEKYDTDGDQLLNLNELKCMMEKLGLPQTHVRLKDMIKHVDEDQDGKISFREFLLIFRQVTNENNAGQLQSVPSLISQLYALLFEIDVAKEGVRGAKHFFEAKITATKDSDFYHRALREEQEQQRRLEETKLRRKLAFEHCRAVFQNS